MGRDKCKEKPQIRETLCFFDEALMAKYGKVLAHKKLRHEYIGVKEGKNTEK